MARSGAGNSPFCIPGRRRFTVLILNLCVLVRLFTDERLVPVRNVVFPALAVGLTLAGMAFLNCSCRVFQACFVTWKCA